MINPHDIVFPMRREGADYVLSTPPVWLESRGSERDDAEVRLGAFLAEMARLSKERGLDLRNSPDPLSRSGAGQDDPKAISRTIRRSMMLVLILVGLSIPALWAAQRVAVVWAHLKERAGSPMQAVALLSGTVHQFADLVDKITPERRNQLTRDLSRIAIGLEPYAAQLRPLWLGSPQENGKAATGRQEDFP